VVNGPVSLTWTPPSQRENGDYLDITEVGGYNLRYKTISASSYTVVNIAGGAIDSYYFNFLQGTYVFEIATYDTAGLYSGFVALNPI
jgi:hypothetical protein